MKGYWESKKGPVKIHDMDDDYLLDVHKSSIERIEKKRKEKEKASEKLYSISKKRSEETKRLHKYKSTQETYQQILNEIDDEADRRGIELDCIE